MEENQQVEKFSLFNFITYSNSQAINDEINFYKIFLSQNPMLDLIFNPIFLASGESKIERENWMSIVFSNYGWVNQ